MIFAIIQARMGSTRLSGKVMLDICEKPVLWHVIERVKQSRFIDEVIIATSEERANDSIRAFCIKSDLLYYSGSENDVLDRFYQAAQTNKVNPDDIVIRITADCPLIDPHIIDKVIEAYQRENADYAANVINPTFPDGLDCEVMKFSALVKAWKEAKLKSEREHVTPYIRNHPELFKQVSVENHIDLSSLRWTLDEKEDFVFIKKTYDQLYQENKVFLMEDILTLIEKNPEIIKINKRFMRNEGLLKSLSEDKIEE